MSGLTDSQQEVARILFGLPESTGFALAGGSALVALGVIDRPTRDLDAFVAARAGDPPGDVGPLAATFSATLAGAGWDVEAVRQHQTFVRLVASRDDDSIEVDLAVDSPPIFPVEVVNGIPTLAPQDLAARKVLAVLDRAEGRDFTDLWTLAREHGQTETIAWVRQLDDGVSASQIAAAFDQLTRLRDDELPCESSDRPIVREWFTTWSEHLRSTLG